MNFFSYLSFYVQQGFYIFPCKPIKGIKGFDKTPYTPHGHLDAVNTIKEATNLFSPYPEAIIGIDCGRSGITVMDVDNKNGKTGNESFMELEIKHEAFPPTWWIITPNAGHHHYFKAPLNAPIRSKEEFFPGIDIKGQGGYVCAPPGGYRFHGEYHPLDTLIAPMPLWLAKILKEKRSSQIVTEDPFFLPETLKQAQTALNFIPPDCEYDEWRKIGMALCKTFGKTGFILWNEWSSRGKKYRPEEMKYKFKSFKKDGISIGTLFYIAKKYKYTRVPDETTSPQKDSPEIQSVENATEDKIGTLDWIYEEWLNTGAYFILTAPQKTGKSYFVTQLAMSAACGKEFLDFHISKPHKVLYLQKEIGDIPLKRRINMLRKLEFKDNWDHLKENFMFSSGLAGLTIDQDTSWLIKMLDSVRPKLLILDTFSRFTSKEISSQKDMLPVMDFIQKISIEYNLCVVIVHHTRKQKDKENSFDIWEKIRGSKVLTEAPDGSIVLLPITAKDIPFGLENKKYINKVHMQLRQVFDTPPPFYVYTESDSPVIFRHDTLFFDKNDKKDKISLLLKFIAENPGLSNSDIEKGLGWAKPTALKYLTIAKDRKAIICTKNTLKNKNEWRLIKNNV